MENYRIVIVLLIAVHTHSECIQPLDIPNLPYYNSSYCRSLAL